MLVNQLIEGVEVPTKSVILRAVDSVDFAQHKFDFWASSLGADHGEFTDKENPEYLKFSVYYVEPRTTERRSKGSSANTQQFLTNLPGWSAVPNRQYAAFGTTAYKHLNLFGGIQTIVLPEASKVAYMKYDWNLQEENEKSKVTTADVNEIISHLDDVSSIFEELEDKFNCEDSDGKIFIDRFNKIVPTLSAIESFCKERTKREFYVKVNTEFATEILNVIVLLVEFYHFLVAKDMDEWSTIPALVKMLFGADAQNATVSMRKFAAHIRSLSANIATVLSDVPTDQIEKTINNPKTFGVNVCSSSKVPLNQEEVWFEGGYYMIVCDNPFFLRMAREGKMKNILDYVQSKIK